MKTQTKKRFFGVVLASVLCSFNVVNAQFAGIFPPPFDDYRTTAPVTAVGIGNFGGANLPQSAFHINTNLSAPSSIFTSGEVFRTTGPTAQDNSWRMFTGAGNGTERFSITTPANSDDAVLSTVQNGAMQFATNGIERMHINQNTGLTNGFIGMGNGFNNPQSHLHINNPLNEETWLQITNVDVGETTTDGLKLGMTRPKKSLHKTTCKYEKERTKETTNSSHFL